jgi:hypothetical protein
LQRTRQNPNARLKSMDLLGRCYRELGMLDFAAQQFEDANFALVYELMGDEGKSIAAMKQIDQIDYGYRNVAARVERSFERQAPDR